MTNERWQRIEQLYHAALERGVSERGPFLDEACGPDEALRREVETLLASDAQAQAFLAESAMHVAPRETSRRAPCRWWGDGSARINCKRCSARAAWARSIARGTRSSVATSP